MFSNDMALKLERGIKKVYGAIEAWGGCTLLSTGITGDDARMAKAAVNAGIRMLEPNHPAVALARGYKGVSIMHEAEKLRHEITIDQMAEVTQGVRNVVGDSIYITVGISGGFTELFPAVLSEADMMKMAMAGADGLHTHKSSFDDLAEFTNMAHKYGLLIDAYIGKRTDRHIYGLFADTPEEVATTAKAMEEVGVDMIGLMTGMSYEGVESGSIPAEIQERLCALVQSVKVPTLAEGGINSDNYKAFKRTGVNILVIGTSFDEVAQQAIENTVSGYRDGLCK